MPATYNDLTADQSVFIALESDINTPEVEYHNADRWLYHAVQVVNEDSNDPATVQIMASLDGENWAQVSEDITDDALVQLSDGSYRFMKAVISAGTAGKTVTVWFSRAYFLPGSGS